MNRLFSAWVSVMLASPCVAQEHLRVKRIPGDHFGASLANVGDLNADGIPDMVVGAPQPAQDLPGYAALISGRDGSLIYRVSGLEVDDHFGVAADGGQDVDGDGVPDFVVSALNRSRRLQEGRPGYALVFSGADGRLIHRLEAPGGAGMFGLGVLLPGDLDGDGKAEIAVTARSDGLATSLVGVGKVFVFSGASGELLYEVAGNHPKDQFAASLAVAGDLDGDSVPDLWIGAPGGRSPGEFEGYVRAVSGKSGQTLFEIVDGVPRAGFGATVVGCARFDGDGRPVLAVGSWRASPSATDAAHLYSSSSQERLLAITSELRHFHPGRVLAFVPSRSGQRGLELLVGDPLTAVDPVRIYKPSGEWEPLGEVPGRPAGGLRSCMLGDLDGDGVNEFAVSSIWATGRGSPAGPPTGVVVIYSGATRSVLFRLTGATAFENQARGDGAGR